MLLLTLTCATHSVHAQGNQQADSLFKLLAVMPDDTAKARAILEAYSLSFWHQDLPEAYNQLKLAARIMEKGEYANDTLLYTIYGNMAHFCMRANAHEYALQHRKKQMDLAEAWNDSLKIAALWGAMAQSYGGLGEHELAIASYRRALPYALKNPDIEKHGRMCTFMSWEFQVLKQNDSAIYYNEIGFAERRKAGYVPGMYSSGMSLIGMHYQDSNYVRIKEIIEILIYASDSGQNKGTREGMANWFGALHEVQGNLDSALYYYNVFRRSKEKTHEVGPMRDIYLNLANLLPKMGRTNEAYDYLKKHKHLNDSIKEAEVKNNLARQREIYDVENKNAEIEKLQQETSLQQIENDEKDKQRLWLLIVLGVTTILVFVALLAYRQKRKSAILLKQQNSIIEEKNHDITDSIQYAKRIQQAILPSLEQIKSALPDSFVFFSPKDIVSGDFFWFTETPWSYYVAVVDCTGHGVPGAMMSMIGFNFLGQIVNEQDIEQPMDILNELHRKVILALNKDYTSRAMKDGMDVALLRIDKKTNKIYYSGAVRPIYIVVDGKLTEIKGDMYSVGGIKDVTTQTFSQHEIEAPPGSCIYLFSDGYADQFGGPGGKKFKYKNLRSMLIKISTLSMDEQRSEVERTFHAWRAELEQVDDVCLMGLRIT
jgi:serine phosphatase RsbU (regulator of sigma subunit)